MTAQASRRPGVSAVRVVGFASLVGVVAGSLLSVRHNAQLDEARELAVPKVVEKAIPQGAPARPTDMMAPDPRSLEGIPPYPNAAPRRMFVGTTRSNGVGAVSWFETQDKVEAVLKFYEKAFAAEKHNTVTGRPSPYRGFVAWFEHQYDADGKKVFGEGTLHMVTVSDENSRRMVFLSATEPMRLLEDQAAALPGGVRVPLGAKPHVVRTGEVEQEHASIFAEYKKLDVETVASQFEKLEVDDSWTVVKRETDPEGAVSFTLARGKFVQVATVHKVGGATELLTSVEEVPETH